MSSKPPPPPKAPSTYCGDQKVESEVGKGKGRVPKCVDSKEDLQKAANAKERAPKEKIPMGGDASGKDSKGKDSKGKDSKGGKTLPKVEEDPEATVSMYSPHTA